MRQPTAKELLDLRDEVLELCRRSDKLGYNITHCFGQVVRDLNYQAGSAALREMNRG